MREAHEGVGPILGSTTALLALLRPGNILEIANVGDSGFRLLRGGSITFSSTVPGLILFY
jgi:serine/threonine protein phosphatase PrpC